MSEASTKDFIPLDYASYEDAVDSTRPEQIPPGQYTFKCDKAGFHEAKSGSVGIRFECKIVNATDPKWTGRKLNYDGWWNTGFLTSAMLAFLGRERWSAWSTESSDPEGLVRLRDGSSDVFPMLAGSTATGTVEHEKGQDGQMWARIKRFVVD